MGDSGIEGMPGLRVSCINIFSASLCKFSLRSKSKYFSLKQETCEKFQRYEMFVSCDFRVKHMQREQAKIA